MYLLRNTEKYLSFVKNCNNLSFSKLFKYLKLNTLSIETELNTMDGKYSECCVKVKRQILFLSSSELFYPYTKNDLSKLLSTPFRSNFGSLEVLGISHGHEYEHSLQINT